MGGQARDLGTDQAAEQEDDSQRQHHREKDGGDFGEVEVAQRADQGGEDEAEQDRQRDGDEDVAAEIEGAYGDDPDGEAEEVTGAGGLGGGNLGLGEREHGRVLGHGSLRSLSVMKVRGWSSRRGERLGALPQAPLGAEPPGPHGLEVG